MTTSAGITRNTPARRRRRSRFPPDRLGSRGVDRGALTVMAPSSGAGTRQAVFVLVADGQDTSSGAILSPQAKDLDSLGPRLPHTRFSTLFTCALAHLWLLAEGDRG